MSRQDYDHDCTACPRLASALAIVRSQHPSYFARPVPAFGAARPDLLIVGLAPGMHGANRTGRPFTGDWCGPLLYSTLHRHGFANQPEALARDDGLQLLNCRVTNAVKCLPPENKPTPAEIKQCNGYLRVELTQCQPRVILALGAVAHQAVLMALDLKRSAYPFAHHAVHELVSGLRLVDSYHVSRYNTQTGRLTPAMFDAVVADIRDYLTHAAR
ncbi:uracil-DNA glycosylase [Parvibium lacunae]|uniref:Type-5 uracil-DNA glycosylase n=1 Tax=Parvibium lacunae TaxID=1888893 RepID=A0A368L4Z6_9BURK|nr:uracil-DNA glycosylase [Parvibium lacunae]RCS58666.1 uracil-DNA glycosylase [Parvibium lacunae]